MGTIFSTATKPTGGSESSSNLLTLLVGKVEPSSIKEFPVS